MRDPELVVRAQLAASALEGAWHRWRVVHGGTAESMPAVSSYVGYSLQEPWGQPRVVFGLAADDAEQLAALIEGHGPREPAYLPAAAHQPGGGLRGVAPPGQPGGGLRGRTSARAATVRVPRQAPLIAANVDLGQPLADVLLADENVGYDEPLYRQAAAALKESAATREKASRVRTDSDDSGSVAAGRSNLADLVSPEWMGSLAMAAFTAKAEAEARIRAALTKPDEAQPDEDQPGEDQPGEDQPGEDQPGEDQPGEDQPGEDQPGDPPEAAAEAGGEGTGAGGPCLDDVEAAGAADGLTVGGEDGEGALPQINATDVLEPLPAPEEAAVADAPVAEEPAAELDQAGLEDGDDQDDYDDVPDQDDHEDAAAVPSDGPGTGVVRRGRVTRGRPIARLSKAKRPGASSRAAGS